MTAAVDITPAPAVDNGGRGPLALRPYQREAVEAVRQALERGVRRQLICLPTGAGKTVVFSHLIRRRRASGRTLVVAHREELLNQACDKLQQIAPDLRVGIVKAERDEHQDVDVIVASIQTLARPRRLDPIVGTVKTVIVDEAHHAVADTYRKVLDELGCLSGAGGPLLVGVTATAGERNDGVGLRVVFDEIVYQRGILTMIADGYLVDVRGLHIQSDLDLRSVVVRGGDYTDSALGEALETSGAIEAAAAGYAQFAADRRGLAFTPTIKTAHELATRLVAHGIPAEAVSGETPTDQRHAILARLHQGQTQVVTNAAVLTEGFDEPAVSCVLVARPTKSRPLYIQMVGRALRPHPGKDDALVLGLFAPPSAGLASIADLAGDDPETKVAVEPGESLAEAVARHATFGAGRLPKNLTAHEIMLFGRSQLHWLPIGKGFALACGQATVLVAPEANDLWRVVESHRDGETRVLASGLSLDYAAGVGEEYARAHAGHLARADAAWRDLDVTPGQKGVLKRMRLPTPRTRGAASDLIATQHAARALVELERVAS